MELESGIYLITSKLEKAPPVGRDLNEDTSLGAKKVVLLPDGIKDPQWEIIALPDGTYIMKIRGGIATEVDRLLFAVVEPEIPEPATWKIQPQFHLGENTYAIFKPSKPEGWFASPEGEPGSQIQVRPILLGPEIPPPHLFVITRFK